jgi:hypothetical protein
MRPFWIPVFWCSVVSACAYPAPSTVGVFVNTFPPGASCALTGSGIVVRQIDSTPGIARVPNETHDYLLSCNRAGFEGVTTVVHARAEVRTLWQELGSTQISAEGGATVNLALVPRRRRNLTVY